MDIKELKLAIEKGDVSCEGIIFISSDTYIPLQYINRIAILNNKEIKYVDSYNLLLKSISIFGFKDDCIKVFICDEFDNDVVLDDFCYIICKKRKKKDCIIVNKLEDWQILDYVITNSSQSISKDDLEYLSKCCSKSMYLVDNEISKYNIFSSSDQKNIFSNLKVSNQFTNLYDKTIFDFTNALLDRDIDKIVEFYRDLDKYDFDSIPIISIMYNQIKNIILVGFNNNPTESNTGLSSKQIYWIRKNLYKYNRDQVIKLFMFISDADSYLKNGLLTNKQLFDFIVINFLQG